MVKQSRPKTKHHEKIPAEVVGALADAFGKSFLTIERWIANHDDRLTSEKAKHIFRNKNIKWE